MIPDRLFRFLRTGGILFLSGLLIWLIFRLLFGWFFPFWVGFFLAAGLERPICFLIHHLHLPRWAAAGLCTLLVALLLFGGVLALLWKLWDTCSALLQDLPSLLAPLSAAGSFSEHWTHRLLVAAPPELRPMLQNGLDALADQAASLPAWLSSAAAAQTAAFFSSLPRWGLTLFTTLLSTYFSAAGYPTLLAFLWRQVPPDHKRAVQTSVVHLRSTFLGWLRAQGMLTLITFSILTTGFFLLGVESPLLPAVFTAITDALPVLGSGLVLVPWSILAFISGNVSFGFSLVGLWGLVIAVRSLLEPKLVGLHAGLPPLPALLAMYVGFQSLGLPGMILAPLGMTMLKALHDAGLLSLWRD